jgi:pyrimidine operon attenuation protein/uracil phosphoribosyltransferase
MEPPQMSLFWTIVSTIVEPICIVIIIVVIRRTRLTRKLKGAIKEAAKEVAENPPRPKIGFQQAQKADESERTPRLPMWPNFFRKIRRLFPPRKLFHSFRAHTFPCCYFYDYCPDRKDRSLRDERNRDMIISYKDGQSEIAVHMVTEFIYRYIPQRDVDNWVFCVIPASTREKNAHRNMLFCALVSKMTGIQNGFKEIIILYDRTDSRQQKEDDTVWNLQFGAGVEGKHVLLFDDIITRGVSFIQCAEKLKSKGAASVTGLFLGKTLR